MTIGSKSILQYELRSDRSNPGALARFNEHGLTLQSTRDVHALHSLQIKAFLPLLEKYKDHEINPACESEEKTLQRINDSLKGFYKILKDDVLVGGIVIKQTAPKTLFLGPIFIDPDYQNQKLLS